MKPLRTDISIASSSGKDSSLIFISAGLRSYPLELARPRDLFYPDFHKLTCPPMYELRFVKTREIGLPVRYLSASYSLSEAKRICSFPSSAVVMTHLTSSLTFVVLDICPLEQQQQHFLSPTQPYITLLQHAVPVLNLSNPSPDLASSPKEK